MDKFKFLFFSIFLLSLSGCLIADELFLESSSDEYSLQDRSEVAVSDYLGIEFGNDYVNYGFGEIKVFKPYLIAKRDSLIKDYLNDPSDEKATIINNLIDTIDTKGLQRRIKISHFYLVESDSDYFDVIESVFELSDTLSVIDFEPTLYTRMKNYKRSILYDFFYEQPIFLTPSFNESVQMSANFYAYYKSRLESYQMMTEKADFLEHSLVITQLVKSMGDYKPQEIAEKMADKYFWNQDSIGPFEILERSTLKEVSSEELGLQGYYFFNKFKVEEDTTVNLFEFSPYLELTNVLKMDKPYEQYFE